MKVSKNLLSVGLRGGICDEKHKVKMGESVWLFMWLIMRQTSEDGSVGSVLGGFPLTYSMIAKDTGHPASSIRKWMRKLREGGYVRLRRVMQGKNCTGLLVHILNAKKFNVKAHPPLSTVGHTPPSMRGHTPPSTDGRIKALRKEKTVEVKTVKGKNKGFDGICASGAESKPRPSVEEAIEGLEEPLRSRMKKGWSEYEREKSMRRVLHVPAETATDV